MGTHWWKGKDTMQVPQRGGPRSHSDYFFRKSRVILEVRAPRMRACVRACDCVEIRSSLTLAATVPMAGCAT